MKIIVILLTMAMLYSCGEDTATDTGGFPVNYVVFSLDSFSLPTFAPGFYDTSYTHNMLYDLDSFKVSFTVYTNNDTNAYDYTRFSVIDNGRSILYEDLHYIQSPTSFLFYGYSDSGYVNKTFKVELGLRNFNIHNYVYITVKNFRVETR